MKKFVAKYASFLVVASAMVFAVTDSAFFINKPKAPKGLMK